MENKDIKIKQGIILELVGQPARVSSTLVVMQGNNTQHKNVGQVLPDNQIKRHSRMSLSGIPTAFNNAQGGDPRTLRAAASGMTTPFKEKALNRNPFRDPLRSGFTLIELLVVILIIAILAAIALPQYQKTVEKSKGAQALALLKPIRLAVDHYYLTQGVYPTKFDQLDIQLPASFTGTTCGYASHVTDCHSNSEWSISLHNERGLHYIMLLRLGGPYDRGGFGYIENDPLRKQGVLYCAEAPGGVWAEEGKYCRKLWKGQKVQFYTAGRWYTFASY